MVPAEALEVGRNKPLKDLAWGLASAGVAAPRLDKVTHAHPEQAPAKTGFMLTDEYIPHAVAAIRLLAHHPAVDAGRVFVAGRSLGGTVAPLEEPAVRLTEVLPRQCPGPSEGSRLRCTRPNSPGASGTDFVSDRPAHAFAATSSRLAARPSSPPGGAAARTASRRQARAARPFLHPVRPPIGVRPISDHHD